MVNHEVKDGENKFQFISQKVFQEKLNDGSITPVGSELSKKRMKNLPSTKSAATIADENPESKTEENLLLGFPIGLLDEQNIFGGVITKVSDSKSDKLGGLKLTDLPPLHVKTLISKQENGAPAITLVGCAADCDEESVQTPLINLPIVGVNQENGLLIVDLSSIGQELDLISMLDPTGEYTELKAVSSATTSFDYSMSTLVFDVKTKMVPVKAENPEDPTTPVTEFTVRWYLKLNSAFNPAFTTRAPTPGVGFFETTRSKNPKITRFSTTNVGQSVKYYIKNVPEKWQPVFAGAISKWNDEFKKIIGREFLSYEFINAGDPRSEEIIPGDIRYNVIEWDLNNIASYGGLGPSIANQFTGETISANVLIQGPKIIELYTKWYETSSQVRSLKEQGNVVAANKLMKEFNLSAENEMKALSSKKFTLKLGKSLAMNVPSQRVELEDPMVKGHFELVPEGVNFEEYMVGYFSEMLDHELGHNLGLRHNFKGNLGAYESKETGSVSRSIMEYLGRPYRHLNAIGLYDKMAISFGYKGIAPTHLNWFCTDEHQGSSVETMATSSAECTKADATSDPYSFWEKRLARAIHLLVDVDSNSAPVWKLSEIMTETSDMITGLTAYAASAEKTSETWTNFFGKGDRPERKEDVKAYVLQSFKDQLCDARLTKIIGEKETQEAKDLATTNLEQLKMLVALNTQALGVFTAEEFKCQ